MRVQDVAEKLNVPVQTVIKKLEELSIYVGAGGGATPLKAEEYMQVVSLITGKKVKMKKKTSEAEAPEAKQEKTSAPAEGTAEKENAAAKEEVSNVKPAEENKPAKTAEAKQEEAHASEVKTPVVPSVRKAKAAAPKEDKQDTAALSREETQVREKTEEVQTGETQIEEIKAPETGKQGAKAQDEKTEAVSETAPVTAEEKQPEEEKKEEKTAQQLKDEKEEKALSAAEAAVNAAIAAGLTPARAVTPAKTIPTKREVKAVPTKREQPKGGPNKRQGVQDGTQGQKGERRGAGKTGETRGQGRQDKPFEGRRGTGAGQGGRPQEGRSRTSGMGERGDRQGFGKPQSGFGGKDVQDKDAPQSPRRSAPARRTDGRKAGGESYDMGLSAPSKHSDTQNYKNKEAGQQRQSNKQRQSGSDEYKSKKTKLMQESSYLDDDRLARHKKKTVKHAPGSNAVVDEEDIKIVALPESMTVKDLADMLHKPLQAVIKALMGMGIMAGLNQIIDFDQAEAIATDMDILVEHQVEEDIFAKYAETQDAEEDLKPRSPVVVVMGHVDHGKTSLLDAIRDTKVTAGEAGGITQHIGASVVTINGQKITFLDTPGHEAFTAMRMRGAMVTDIAVLVVAADDGVMPQTIEAINHAKAAGVQIIVAINKMDKPSANPDRVKQELTEYGLICEEWGGSTICVPVSAVKREGIDDLLENILLVADVLDLKANPDRLAVGTVVESQLDKGRGTVATVLVQKGTLRVGDPIVAGTAYGRVKAMTDDKGRRVKEAGPSTPVEITGLSEVPSAGDVFYMTDGDREARLLAEKVAARERVKLIEGNKKVNLNDLFGDIQAGEVKDLNILVKADVQGSVEAVKQSLEKLSNDQVQVKVIHGAVGAINESDVMLAAAANAIIIGFNVRPDVTAKNTAEEQKVDVRLYRVIYNAIDDITAAMKGMLAPEFEEKVNGHATVRQIFHASGIGTIAGSYVTDGKIVRNSQVRLVRDGIVVYEGTMASLRRFKDDVKEVSTGYECGIMLEKFNDVKEGDVIEAFSMEEIKRD
ncbi:MAG: translation initiation factor IF-2 [Lachnospiraceae bacterium]|nr:translation initiation factor IF-2 [Lachnospiraceae bacterium]